MVAINLKLAKERGYEMKMARVLVGKELPHGYRKRFFVNLCRAIFPPEISDDEARERVVRVAEEGINAIAAFGIATSQLPVIRPTSDEVAGQAAPRDTEGQPEDTQPFAKAETADDPIPIGTLFR